MPNNHLSRVPVSLRLRPESIEELTLLAKKEGKPFGTYVQELLEDFAPGRDINLLRRQVKEKQKKK